MSGFQPLRSHAPRATLVYAEGTPFGAVSPVMRKAWDLAEERSKRRSDFLTNRFLGDRNCFWTATGRLSPKNGRMRPVCRYIGP